MESLKETAHSVLSAVDLVLNFLRKQKNSKVKDVGSTHCPVLSCGEKIWKT